VTLPPSLVSVYRCYHQMTSFLISLLCLKPSVHQLKILVQLINTTQLHVRSGRTSQIGTLYKFNKMLGLQCTMKFSYNLGQKCVVVRR